MTVVNASLLLQYLTVFSTSHVQIPFALDSQSNTKNRTFKTPSPTSSVFCNEHRNRSSSLLTLCINNLTYIKSVSFQKMLYNYNVSHLEHRLPRRCSIFTERKRVNSARVTSRRYSRFTLYTHTHSKALSGWVSYSRKPP